MSQSRRVVVSGLSPAWQQIVLLESLRVGEVNRAAAVHWCASGKVLNVGRALHALGADQTTVALVGGTAGEQICAEWKAEGIAARWVLAARPTRVCTTLLQQDQNSVTELVENAAEASAAELDEHMKVYAATAADAALTVHTGSLPAGAPSDWYARALRAENRPAILDVRGPELLAALSEKPLLVKPNREELAKTIGEPLPDERDVWSAMETLLAGGAEWALVTQGGSAALLAGPEGRWRVRPQCVSAVNPIGCGDCLTAGLAAHLVRTCDNPARPTAAEMLAAVRYGVAAAAENAGTLLPARLDPDRVAEFAARVVIEPNATT